MKSKSKRTAHRRNKAPLDTCAEQLLLDEKQAAKLLGVAPVTMQRYRVNGDGPVFVKLSPRCVRYTREALLAYANARTFKSTSAADVALAQAGA